MEFGKTDPQKMADQEKRLKNRQRQYEDRGKILRMKEGSNYVRILPSVEDVGIWFIENPTHFIIIDDSNPKNPQKVGVPCLKEDPSDKNSVCPSCERASEAIASDDKDRQEWGKDLRSTLKYGTVAIDVSPAYDKDGNPFYLDDGATLEIPECWVVKFDGGERSKCRRCSWFSSCEMGPIAFPVGTKIFTPIFELVNRGTKRNIDILDPKNGHTFCVTRKGTTRFGTEYTVTPDMESSALPAHVIKAIKEKMINIIEWREGEKVTREKMIELLDGESTSFPGDEGTGETPECVGEFYRDGECSEKNCDYREICQKESTPAENAPAEEDPPPPPRRRSRKAAAPKEEPKQPSTPDCFGKYDDNSKRCDGCPSLLDCRDGGNGDEKKNGKKTGKKGEESEIRRRLDDL